MYNIQMLVIYLQKTIHINGQQKHFTSNIAIWGLGQEGFIDFILPVGGFDDVSTISQELIWEEGDTLCVNMDVVNFDDINSLNNEFLYSPYQHLLFVFQVVWILQLLTLTQMQPVKIFVNFLGCTDDAADNYNPNANVDDGSCEYLGCTDPIATNYDPNSNVDDGSCEYDYPDIEITSLTNTQYCTQFICDPMIDWSLTLTNVGDAVATSFLCR